MRSFFKKFLGKSDKKNASLCVETEGDISDNYLVLDETTRDHSYDIHNILNILEKNSELDSDELAIYLSEQEEHFQVEEETQTALEVQEEARIKAEQVAAEKLRLERIEAARIAFEQQEQARIKAEQVAAEKLRLERIEADRIAHKRQKQARIKAEKAAVEKLKLEQLDAERKVIENFETELHLDVLDSFEDLDEEYMTENTSFSMEPLDFGEINWLDNEEDEEENTPEKDLAELLELQLIEPLLNSYEYETTYFYEDEIEEEKLEEERFSSGKTSIDAETRIHQIVWDFIDANDCIEYKSTLEEIFWGIHNTHSLVANHIVRRSKAQETAVQKLIIDYQVTPKDLELAFFLKKLWNDNEFLWNSFSLNRSRTSSSHFKKNYKRLSWEVCYEFIHSFPFLSDKTLIEEFLFSLYSQWFENFNIHGRLRYRAFLFYLREIMEIAQDHGERAQYLLQNYEGGFDEVENFIDSLMMDEYGDLKVLLELDYAEL